MTRLGWPADTASVAALLLGAALLLAWPLRQRLPKLGARSALWLLSLTAALLSAGYVSEYLRGGPRIIDATSYYLQARTFASGQLGFTPPEPEAAHLGRFLVSMPDGRLSTLFPPGYPAWLALGFLLHAPMWIGPLTAALVTAATYWLAQRCFAERRLSLLAAAMSTACAVLRYHTADTMAHGLCALLVAACLACVLENSRRFLLLGGLLLGWLCATRPVTGVVVAAVMLFVVYRSARPGAQRRASLSSLAMASVGVTLLLLQQHAVTGHWLQSTQYRYYQLADAPAGCFRFGFGSQVGCRGEHAEFVARYLPHGYGAWQAVGTTLRRLARHLADAGNQELFFLALLAAPVLGRSNARVRLLSSVVALQVLAYAGFYFDGNYPGGGARMFADVLPVEHVLLAWVLCRLSLGFAALPSMLFGFALHTSFDHQKLRDRDGGSPMYDPSLVKERVEPRALVFVSTDHGYNLGFDPQGSGARIARAKGDALDWASWVAAGRPRAYRYEFDPGARRAEARLRPFLPRETTRFEAENQWPLLSGSVSGVRRGPGPGGAEGLWLGRGTAELALWVAKAGHYRVALRAAGELGVRLPGGNPLPIAVDGVNEVSTEVEAATPGNLRLVLDVSTAAFVDWLELEPVSGAVTR